MCCGNIQHVGIPHIFSASHSHPNIYEFFLFYIIFSLILLIEYKIIIKINKYYQSIKSTLFFSSLVWTYVQHIYFNYHLLRLRRFALQTILFVIHFWPRNFKLADECVYSSFLLKLLYQTGNTPTQQLEILRTWKTSQPGNN